MGAALAFIGAVFFGVGAGASLAYVVAVNLARIAILSLVSKALAPKIDLSQAAADKLLTVRSSFQPQAFVYGEDMLSGPLLFANTAGEGNVDLHRLVALTGREIDSFVAFRIDDTDIVIGDDIASDAGPVTGGQFADVMEIDTRTGTQTQTAIAELVAAFPGNWTAAHQGLGWALFYTKMTLVEGNEAFESGIPQNLRAVVKGSKVYDPRVVGHDFDDPSTWEWSDNPALILADFLIWQDVGYGEVPERIDWTLVEAAADICEEQVVIPGDDSDGGLQNRYTCNFTFYADQTRQDIREIIVNSMLGRCIFSQGKWRMWAGAALPATVTLSEANLAGSIQLQASTPSEHRYNRVRGKFVDPSRNYTANPYPEQRDAAYETADNEIKYQTFDQNACNNSYEAQRNAIIRLRQSRLQRVITFQGNWSCFRVQTGTTVEIDIAELGLSGDKYFVTEWILDKDGRGVNLTMTQESDDVWTDPDDYVVRSPTGELIFESQPPPAGDQLGNMVMLSDGGTFRAAYSPGNAIWHGRSLTTQDWEDVEYAGDGIFVGVSSSGAGNRIARSVDTGITWALVSEFAVGERRYNNILRLASGRLIVATNNNAATIDNFISSDDQGATWTRRDSTGLTGLQCRQLTEHDGILLAVGSHAADDNVLKSVDDGNNWTGYFNNGTGGSSGMQACAWHSGLGLFVGATGFGHVVTSPDGETWTTIATSGTVNGSGNYMIWNPALSRLFLAHASGISSSPDGVNWTTVATPSSGGFNKVIYNPANGFMFAVRTSTTDANCWASVNGTTWQPQVGPWTSGIPFLTIAAATD